MPSVSKLWPAAGSTAIYSGAGFTNPTRVSADDASYATGTANATPGTRYGNWSFGIPAGATINSVVFETEYLLNVSSAVTLTVRARVGGVDQVAHTDTSRPTVATVKTFTATTDRAWVAADFANGTFELVLAASGALPTVVSVDYLKVTVDYTPGVPQSLAVGKVSSAAAVRGVYFGALNLGKIASPATVRGVFVSQTGDVQYLPVGKVSASLSGDLGAAWTTPAFGLSAGLLVIAQSHLACATVGEGAAVYTAAQLAADWGARFTLTASIMAGGRVRLLLVSDTAGTNGYVLTIDDDGTATVAEIGGAAILTEELGTPAVGDEYGLAKIGDYFQLFYRPEGETDWTEPAAASGGTYDAPVYVGFTLWPGASVDDLYVDGLL